jgi:NAD(P)-dependent dehydrogenase (short-subunit alcohol dehydrogenase family)
MAKTALITGAGSGIGRASALALAARGWQLTLVGRRRDALEETAALATGEPLVATGDIAVPDDVTRIFAESVAKWGRLDLLFNNAGRGSPPLDIDETPLEDWYGVINANLHGSFLCARAAFGQMKGQTPKGGRIINNGSISAYAPRPGSVPYTVSKHAITGLTKTLSLDGRKHDIAVGQLDIGNALTEMAQKMTEGVPQADGSIKIEAVMDPNHVAEAVVQMAEFPLETNVQFMTIMATKMPYVGRG